MKDLNSVIVEGRLTRDAEAGATRGGTAVVKFSIASNRYFKKDNEIQEEVSFFDVEAFGRMAEWNRDLAKGTKVRVTGRIQQDRWERDGQSRSKVKIVADHIDQERGRRDEARPQAEQGNSADFDDDVPF